MTSSPLVSVLLCTHGERHLLPIALSSYASQTWAPRELVVIADGTDIFDMVENIPSLVYVRLPQDAKTLSAKRNIGCQYARGEFVVHFDSDDFSGPDRISDQVEMMLANPGAKVGGYAQAYWYDFVDRRASKYNGSIWGASMIYRREWALANPWDESVSNAEDGPFRTAAESKGLRVHKDGAQNFVATLHNGNARRTAIGTSCWPFVEVSELPEAFRKFAEI